MVLVFSWLVERDTGEVSELVSEQTRPLAEGLEQVRGDHGKLIDDLRSELADLEIRTRSAVEGVGGTLAPKAIRIRASITVGPVMVSVALLRRDGAERQSFLIKVRRGLRRVWCLFWGTRRRA